MRLFFGFWFFYVLVYDHCKKAYCIISTSYNTINTKAYLCIN